ncbi:MAG: tetratricopeptide repeat protein [Acidobacteriia bacterium]|nr:tetratricopeptide repeat protein [Terriglobia bacterium]
MIRRFYLYPSLLLLFLVFFPRTLPAQLQPLGNVTGRLQVANGDVPSHQVLVELRLRGATMNSVYADAEGYFSFASLEPNPYHIVINDDAYYPVDVREDVNPETPNNRVEIYLRAREDPKKSDPISGRASGSNPNLVDPADYNKRFPKKAVKEFERGVNAEHKGERDEAIAHYEGALKIAPDYYPAHNNLGSLYLGKSDFKSAEAQFRESVRLDQNEAQAYFNLGNVLMLTGRYSESEAAVEAGLQRRPDSAFARYLQGCLSARAGKFAEAEKSLREALQLDPSMWQAHLQLVNLYREQKRTEDAIHQLQDFLKAFPSSPTAAKAREVLNKLQRQEAARNR